MNDGYLRWTGRSVGTSMAGKAGGKVGWEREEDWLLGTEDSSVRTDLPGFSESMASGGGVELDPFPKEELEVKKRSRVLRSEVSDGPLDFFFFCDEFGVFAFDEG